MEVTGLFNVRHAGRVDDATRLQFDETAKVCAKIGWRHRVLTGRGTLAARNLDALSASPHERCAPTLDREAQILNAARDGRAQCELCESRLRGARRHRRRGRQPRLAPDLVAVFSSDAVFTTSEHIWEGVRVDARGAQAVAW